MKYLADFDKIFIIPKLDAVDEPVVKNITALIINAAAYADLQVLTTSSQVCDRTLVIAVGGDGTMLAAMRLAAEHKAIATGINLGKVGFLTDFGYTDRQFRNELDSLFQRPYLYPVELRTALRIYSSIECLERSGNIVLNEYVLSNLYSDEIITYTLKINGIDAGEHRANGIIVGTPTGSTAYTLSNGGALLYPSMNVMQIVPVAPLSLTSRPIIVPGDAKVSIQVQTQGNYILKGDGARLYEFKPTDRPDLTFTEHFSPVRVVHPTNWNFFDVLTEKLGWRKR
jgi:NAD+ kinase